MRGPGHDSSPGPSLLARELIRAGRTERAAPSALGRAEHALLTAAGPSAATAGPVTVGGWLAGAKWIGLTALIVVAGGAGMSRSPENGAMRSPAIASSTQAKGAASVEQNIGPTRDSASQPPLTIGSTRSEIPEERAHSAVPSKAFASARDVASVSLPSPSLTAVSTSTPTANGSDRELARELEALAAARAALGRGIPAQALSATAPGKFRLLHLEASIVRVEALKTSGQFQASASLARELLQRHPSGPYSERLRALLSEGGARR